MRRKGHWHLFARLATCVLGAAIFITVTSVARGQANGNSAPTAQPAPAASPAAAKAEDISFLQLALKGGIWMYPLALCSVIAIAIILERFAALRRGRVLPSGFMNALRGVFRDPMRDRGAALAHCQANDSAIARVMAAGIKHLPRGWPAAEKAMEDAGAIEAIKLRQNMRLLYSLGSVATLLGLIGTISGMIKAFQVAAVAGVGRVDQLSRGIYEAMVCTFAGLAVAIVVTPFYYYFAGRIERLVADLSEAVTRFGDDHALPGGTVAEVVPTSEPRHAAPAPAPAPAAALPATPAIA
jgi:biopolymer transport protein ExbB